ncbi:MAG TPA: peptidoglycan-binding domain-containing protein [Pyrinomonadaceae bacterium]|jgi:peptidoglycan hydrolase-like protein with peptidoglycan-binding domain|nr:peptidoglycan-binding domain-containing protein [Pyrinomonadaceae bacterium]
MRRLLVAFLTLLFCAASVSLAAQQNTNSATASQEGGAKTKPAVKRGTVFRSTKEQIKQAQTLLKTRGFYNGQEDGKLNDDTRAALRKYQEAEGLKITGTLNKVTLERMGVVLNDRQKEWKPAT